MELLLAFVVLNVVIGLRRRHRELPTIWLLVGVATVMAVGYLSRRVI